MSISAEGKKILLEDIDAVASSINAEFFKDKTVLVTGATGLLGSLTVKSVLRLNEKKNTNINVIAWARNPEKANAVFEDYLDDSHLKFVYCDILETPEFPSEPDFIIHTASATSSKFFVTNPVETISIAINGTCAILDIAKMYKAKVLYLSSLEVYGTPDGNKEFITESDYGYIEPLSVRSSYSEGKRMVECICASYASQYGVDVKIARLSQTFGAGVEYNDGRVFAEFTRCALEKKDIVLHTAGNTVRTYCYTSDAVSAFFKILEKGETAVAYNVTNRDTSCSIKEMAQLVCDTFGDSGISVKIEIPEDVASFGYNPEMIIRIDPSRLEALGWQPKVGLADMFRRTAAYIAK